MSKVNVNVDAGICGFKTAIAAQSSDGQNAQVVFRTDCPSLKPLEEKLTEVDGYTACFGNPCDSSVYQAVNTYCAHAACPVPSAIIKAVEAACGLALPKDAHIEMTKADE